MTAIPEPVQIAIWYLTFIFALTVHECAHAWTAWRCGDSTAKLMGRMTLNPLPHMDPLGTVLIPLLPLIIGLFTGGAGLGFALIGWGKPVPVNPAHFRHARRDDVLVSLAGPFSNLIITIIALALLRVCVLLPLPELNQAASIIFGSLARISFCLAFFNMLPIPPLDGSHLLRFFLPYTARHMFDQIARHGFIILIILINTPVWRLCIFALVFLYALLCSLFGVNPW